MKKTYLVGFQDGTYRYVTAVEEERIRMYYGTANVKSVAILEVVSIKF